MGCAGWTLPQGSKAHFPPAGSHLERYAVRLNGAEINSSFYRPHQPETYARWADAVPCAFRFSVKLPKTITHEARLSRTEALLDSFLAQVRGLGERLGCLLVQLPPGLAFDARLVRSFLEALRRRHDGLVACEPRHASWFTPEAHALLCANRISRVLADPVLHATGERPAGWPGLVYCRLHGSPRMYYSAYSTQTIAALADRIALARQDGTQVWCMFDNTASGAATADALALSRRLQLTPAAA